MFPSPHNVWLKGNYLLKPFNKKELKSVSSYNNNEDQPSLVWNEQL